MLVLVLFLPRNNKKKLHQKVQAGKWKHLLFVYVGLCVHECVRARCGMLLCLTKNSILAGPFVYSHCLNTKPAQVHLARRLGCTLPALFAADPALYRVGSAATSLHGLPRTRLTARTTHLKMT